MDGNGLELRRVRVIELLYEGALKMNAECGTNAFEARRLRSGQCTPHAPREDGAATDNGSLRFGKQRKFLTRSVRNFNFPALPCTAGAG